MSVPRMDGFSYPIVVSQNPEGMLFSAPDFPGIEYVSPDFQDGLRFMTEQLGDAVLTMPTPPAATPAERIPVEPGQAVVYAAV